VIDSPSLRDPEPGSARAQAAGSGGSGVGFWELLGSSPQDRLGAVLIFAGAVAVLYAVLVQFRL
jgi:hypothetical protein